MTEDRIAKAARLLRCWYCWSKLDPQHDYVQPENIPYDDGLCFDCFHSPPLWAFGEHKDELPPLGEAVTGR